MITAIIVDDEPYSCESLAILLERFCPDVKLLDTCYSAAEALKSIAELKPELLFLDIEMPHMNGFELLTKVQEMHFAVIFTTSYDQYAIKAFKFSAIDYLLKPINRDELQKAVQKAVNQADHISAQQIKLLLERINRPKDEISKIAIPTLEGLQMIPVDSIVHCDADRNYTVIHLKDYGKIIASKTLKEVEELLEDCLFTRVHHSHIVNLNEIEKYVKGEGGYLLMSNGKSIDVSRSKRELLLKKLQPGKS